MQNVEAFGKFMQYPTLLSFRCQKTIHNILWYFFTNEFEFLATATGFTQRNNSKPFNHATKSIDVYCVQQNILIDHQIKEKQRWKVSKALLSLSIFLYKLHSGIFLAELKLFEYSLCKLRKSMEQHTTGNLWPKWLIVKS